jgi:hypothetical protein
MKRLWSWLLWCLYLSPVMWRSRGIPYDVWRKWLLWTKCGNYGGKAHRHGHSMFLDNKLEDKRFGLLSLLLSPKIHYLVYLVEYGARRFITLFTEHLMRSEDPLSCLLSLVWSQKVHYLVYLVPYGARRFIVLFSYSSMEPEDSLPYSLNIWCSHKIHYLVYWASYGSRRFIILFT